MFQFISDNILSILGSLVLVGGAIWGVWKYNNKKVVNSTKLENRVGNLEDDFKEEKENGAEHHKALYEKLECVSKDVAFIRGKLE